MWSAGCKERTKITFIHSFIHTYVYYNALTKWGNENEIENEDWDHTRPLYGNELSDFCLWGLFLEVVDLDALWF